MIQKTVKFNHKVEKASLAISIKTFNRLDHLKKCVESIYKYCDVSFRLYISDDSTENLEESKQLYEDLIAEGHHVKIYSKRISVTKARNQIVDSLLNEKFLLRLDDDFRFTNMTKVSVMKSILEEKMEIGAIADIEMQLGYGKALESGAISSAQGYFVKKDETLYKINVPIENWIWMSVNNHKYAIAQFTRNFLLIRRDVFSKVRWNENLIIQGEHTAFMLELQLNGWLLAFTPESMHIHDETNHNIPSSYLKSRRSKVGSKIKMEVYKSEFSIVAIKDLPIDSLISLKKRLRIIHFLKNFIKKLFVN